MTPTATLATLTLLLELLLPSAPAAPAAEATAPAKPDCLSCHGEKDFTAKRKDGTTRSLFADKKALAGSVHKDNACTDCHTSLTKESHGDVAGAPVKGKPVPASKSCGSCHEPKPGLHGRLVQHNKDFACGTCHGSHAIQKVAPRKTTCLSCHQQKLGVTLKQGERLNLGIDPTVLKGSVHKKIRCQVCHSGFTMGAHPVNSLRTRRDVTLTYASICKQCHFSMYTRTLDSDHYRLVKSGNTKAPLCIDCHGGHGVQSGHKERRLTAQACQKCHQKVFATYAKSVHGAGLLSGKKKHVPSCFHCHTAHSNTNPHVTDFRNNIPHLCGNCHADEKKMKSAGLSTKVVDTYLDDFHGVTFSFRKKHHKSSRKIAVCVDCHGIHDIQSTRGKSRAEIKRRVLERCRHCHPKASAAFSDAWVSHWGPDARRAPLVFLVHWFYRILIPVMLFGLLLQVLLHFWQYLVRARRRPSQPERTAPRVRRHSTYRIVEHLAVGLLFVGLAVTGLSQRFHTQGWAQWAIEGLGGIDATRVIHRYLALGFSTLLAAHVLIASYGLLFRGWRPSMIVTKRDFIDVYQNVRHWLFLSEKPARYDRYDYRSKFEYWGILVGGLLMTVSGFILWYPVQFLELLPFVSGQVIPAAKAVHSNEAVLALLVVAIWHLYNTILNPEIYPLDTSIFTGKISVEQQRHEHPLEYEREHAGSTESDPD